MAEPALKQPATRPVDRFTEVLRQHMPELRQRYGVTSLGVFGSYVRGDQKKRSDLDVLVEFDGRPMGLLKYIELENYLSDLLGVKVDLVERSALVRKPAIGERILEEVRSV